MLYLVRIFTNFMILFLTYSFLYKLTGFNPAKKSSPFPAKLQSSILQSASVLQVESSLTKNCTWQISQHSSLQVPQCTTSSSIIARLKLRTHRLQKACTISLGSYGYMLRMYSLVLMCYLKDAAESLEWNTLKRVVYSSFEYFSLTSDMILALSRMHFSSSQTMSFMIFSSSFKPSSTYSTNLQPSKNLRMLDLGLSTSQFWSYSFEGRLTDLILITSFQPMNQQFLD